MSLLEGMVALLATCANCAKINNFMLRMCVHISGGFFAVMSYPCKVDTMVFVILLRVRKVNFLNM